ncbi:MAG: glycoside hydrolase, partial [Pseudomonadota bacterium]
MAKQVFVILAFHAHEPLWELPGYLMRNSLDRSICMAVTPENHLTKRTTRGRNIYQDMLAASRRLSAPFTLDISNDLLVQIGNQLPQTLQAMAEAYRKGWLRPLYTTAHHTHAALLGEDELREEINLNRQLLHEVLEVPAPRHPGLFFTECSIDQRFVRTVEDMGMEWCVFPELNPRRAAYTVSHPSYDYTFSPFRVGRQLIGLPRHFPVSQAIWRPITRLDPEGVKYQGYLMGRYFVFDEEYRTRALLKSPISREEAFEEYRLLLERTLQSAPPGGLILYIQDLELMDFGDIAMEILTAAWERVRQDDRWRIEFVGADEYLETLDLAALPRVGFHQTSWAPELRLVLRSDGHYPPLEAGIFRGLDFVAEVHRQRPFIFWEPGRYLCGVFEWLLRSFGFSLLVEVAAGILAEEDYQLLRLPYSKRLPLHLRFLKQADNWGWMPNEDQAKRPYLHA